MIAEDAVVDELADVSPTARIWGNAQIREKAVVGDGTVVGRGAYIDVGVRVGARCKIQNNALIYAPAIVGDGVFVGPAAVLTNDLLPRAVNPDGTIKGPSDWAMAGVVVHDGASIGAGAVLIAGVEVGEWAMIAAGAVVSADVPAFGLMVGVPAKRVGWVGKGGGRLEGHGDELIDVSTGDRYRELSPQELIRL